MAREANTNWNELGLFLKVTLIERQKVGWYDWYEGILGFVGNGVFFGFLNASIHVGWYH